MPAPTSPARRVLADKTPNASIRRAHEPVAKPYLDHLKLDESEALIKYAVEMEVDRNITPRAGQKRRIHEVDGTEEEPHHEQHRPNSLSPPPALSTEPNSETDDGDFLSTGQTKSPGSTSQTSFQASQEPFVTVEDQFGIEEEMSQQTLDKIHAMPMSNNASQLQPPLPPVLAAEISQDSLHMSSFIDFEPDEPEEARSRTIPPASTVSMASRLGRAAIEEARPLNSGLDKAETLRTRLQLALYKVQTNQVSKPFSRLEQPRCASPKLPPQPPGLSGTSPEGIIAAARARATQQKKPAVRNLNSLPIPIIVPTAYSARYMPEKEERLPPSYDAATCSSKGAKSFERSSTPTLGHEDQTTFPKTPMQLSSPPRSDDGPRVKESQGKKLVVGLTSSVVKGEAANGLLELMRAAAA